VDALSDERPTGILDPGAIDEITVEDGVTTLHLWQTCEWDGSEHLLLLLQEKLFNYLSFVADGELARARRGRPSRWQVRVDCRTEPDARTLELVRAAAGQFESLGGRLEIRPPPKGRR
jgi:hypothetical protein